MRRAGEFLRENVVGIAQGVRQVVADGTAIFRRPRSQREIQKELTEKFGGRVKEYRVKTLRLQGSENEGGIMDGIVRRKVNNLGWERNPLARKS